jgi:hypothetical protein
VFEYRTSCATELGMVRYLIEEVWEIPNAGPRGAGFVTRPRAYCIHE